MKPTAVNTDSKPNRPTSKMKKATLLVNKPATASPNISEPLSARWSNRRKLSLEAFEVVSQTLMNAFTKCARSAFAPKQHNRRPPINHLHCQPMSKSTNSRSFRASGKQAKFLINRKFFKVGSFSLPSSS